MNDSYNTTVSDNSSINCSHHLMVRIQDFHSCHTSSILVESTIEDKDIGKSPVTTGMIINLKRFKTMAKSAKELTKVKARQTKLGKKNNDELIQIILKKDKVERNLNNQIKSLKGEVNALSTRVKNFDSDMEGTIQAIESYKDKIKALQEKNDTISIESKDNRSLYEEENKKAITFKNKADMWKVATYVMTIIAIAAIGVTIF